jgi:hypothetical protein
MRNVRAHIAETAANIRPLVRLADWTCVSATTQGPDFRLGSGLIRKPRM